MITRKKRIFISIIQLIHWRDRGRNWVSFVQSFLNWNAIILYGGIISLKFPQIPLFTIVAVIVLVGIVMEGIKLIIGYIDFKKGFWRMEQEWEQKTGVISPFNIELRETLIEICKEIGVKDKFKDIGQV